MLALLSLSFFCLLVRVNITAASKHPINTTPAATTPMITPKSLSSVYTLTLIKCRFNAPFVINVTAAVVAPGLAVEPVAEPVGESVGEPVVAPVVPPVVALILDGTVK
jgi:hypothetical protein